MAWRGASGLRRCRSRMSNQFQAAAAVGARVTALVSLGADVHPGLTPRMTGSWSPSHDLLADPQRPVKHEGTCEVLRAYR